MAGSSLDENRMNVGVSIAQLPLPQGQLGPKLCLRSIPKTLLPEYPVLPRTLTSCPFHQKRTFLTLKGRAVIFIQASQEHRFIWWGFTLSLPCTTPPPHPVPTTSESHLQRSVFNLSVIPSALLAP